METKTIPVGQNPEVDFPSWMCQHAVPYFNVEEGDLRVCKECFDLLDAGAIVVDECSGAPVLWGDTYRKAGDTYKNLTRKNLELKELTDYFDAWLVSATVEEYVEALGGEYEYQVNFSGLSESEAILLIETAKKISGHEARPARGPVDCGTFEGRQK